VTPEPKPRVSEVLAEVCVVCGVTESDLYGDERTAPIVRAKEVAVVVFKDYLGRSFSEIAAVMMKKSHNTFVTRYHRVKDAETLSRIERVKAKFGGLNEQHT
jgi:chromosomal replication initiation ATPase DnaA